MNRLTAIGIASLVAYGVLLVAKWGDAPAGREAAPAAGRMAPAAAAFAPGSAGSLIAANATSRPGAMPLAGPVSVPVVTRPVTGVAADFRNARDLKAFADSLMARKGQLTAEERFYLAKALESCLFANSVNEDLASHSAKQRKQFLASLPAGDPVAAQRIAAYDAVDDAARCVRFQGVKISQRDIDDHYRAAAQLGDARAQAKLLTTELQQRLAAQPRDENGGPARLAPEDLARIVSLLETRDPEAILSVGSLLAQSPLKELLRVGPNGEIPEPSAFIGAWNLVACDLGLDCGAQHRDLAQACAFASYCGAGHFEEHYQTFIASPFVYQQAQRYRALIHAALGTQDWAQIGLGPKLTTATRVASR
jgi:hypothetical protein